jgi:NAD(P)-dependent dehydrogenase (short-subunit alcohol dehydrogenase family)
MDYLSRRGEQQKCGLDTGDPIMTDHSLVGKAVLIAGGAKNLGGLLAADLARHGATAVAVHYNSDAARAKADETLAAIAAAGARASPFKPI